MRKYLFLLLLLIPGSLLADTVSKETASKAATNFFITNNHATKASVKVDQIWSDDNLYIFGSSNGGFVVISGDDIVRPVLAYSTEGRFITEDMPDNIRWWFNAMGEAIEISRKEGLKADKKTIEDWDALLNPTKEGGSANEPVVLMETALWDQGKPYNIKCPTVNGKSTVTGCVATAGAIVMRYHQWPFAGKGTLPEWSFTSDSYINVTIEARELGYLYDWDNMPLTKPVSEAEQEAVATLISDVGLMAKCQYTHNATGAFTEDLYNGLLTYMQFSEDARYLDRKGHSTEEWCAMLQKDLREVGPVLYAGSGADGGHQFVFDGYDNQGYFHVNWGWSGNDNGFFSIDQLKPSSSAAFNQYEDAILGLSPATFLEPGAIQLTASSTTDVSVFDYEHTFFVRANVINKFGGNYSGRFAVALCNSKGEQKMIVSEDCPIKEKDLTNSTEIAVACVIGKDDVEEGDKLVLLCKNAGQKEWETVKGTSSKITNGIAVKNFDSIDSFTSVTYDNTSKTLTVKTKSSVEWTVKDEKGSNVSSVGFSGGKLDIQTAELPAGTYKITLKYEGQTKEFTFKAGK